MIEPSEIDAGSQLCAMTFTANGKYLAGGDWERVRVWRLEDGKHVATMETGPVFCLAVSKNGRWMAAGTVTGKVVVWNATTYEQAISHDEDHDIHAVDFSPNSTRLLVASRSTTAVVLDPVTAKQVQTFHHDDHVVSAKYSCFGDQIATATPASVRVWDGDDGHLLVEIPVTVVPLFNTGLVWFQNSHILVVSESKINKVDASTGSIVSEWPAPHTDRFSYIALPRHREFVIHATSHTLTFWDSTTHSRFALSVRHPRGISSVAHSPGDRFLAMCGGDGTILIESLFHIAESLPLARVHCSFQELEIHLHATLGSFKPDQLLNEESQLTAAIHGIESPSNHLLASRALIRARLQQWEPALLDAEMSIDVRPSVIGYIAKSVAHVFAGDRNKAYHACDIAFKHFHSSQGAFILLIKAIMMSIAGEHREAISRLDDFIVADPGNSIYYVVQAYMHVLLGNLFMEHDDYEGAVQSFERARAQMRHHASQPLSVVSLISGWGFETLGITIRQRLCEALYAVGRAEDAGESLLEMVVTFDEEVYSDPIIKWVFDFAKKCLESPRNAGDTTLIPTQHANPYANPTPLLKEWTKIALTIDEWRDALATAVNFKIPRVIVYQVVCTHLEVLERIADAVECFHQMMSELGINLQDRHREWAHCFTQRCFEKLANLGDTAARTEQYDKAISHYTIALSLNPPSPEDILIKRSKAFVATGSWKQALNDANQVIALDASLPWGYEMKHAALHKAEDYDNAVLAFEAMLEKMEVSFDPDIRRRRPEYKTPARTRAEIRNVVKRTIRDSPHLLINTITGRLYDRDKRAALFESLPVFHELVSSMTTCLDRARIRHEVRQYFQYAVFSHRWEDNEPLFDHVVKIAVYNLNQSPTHGKLQMFCKVVHAAGFNWAWSDTCCINKSDHFVLQESLVAMFKWYRGSALMVVFLRGVCSSSLAGALARSEWNTRGWTLQEYIAARTIRFYTEDWTLYRDLELANHKESSDIVSEMKEATEVSAEQLMALRPGLTSIREKLRLASTRKTTRVEDSAYSLLGIFSAVGLPAIYGEGEASLGRLLANVLTRSGDVSILAWTGESGRFNSCLPARITVFKLLATSHLPPPISDAKMETMVRNYSLDVDAGLRLYDYLERLPTPRFAESRMTLPCIAFELPSLYRTRQARVFRADTDTFGTVEIKTKCNLARMGALYIVHPWLDTLLEREATQTGTAVDDHIVPFTPIRDNDEDSDDEDDEDEGNSEEGDEGAIDDEDEDDSEPELPSYSAPAHVVPMDKEMRARRLIAYLGQPFGALLLASTGQRAGDYRRVAADCLVKVQFQEDVSLDDILNHACTLDVL